MSNSFYNTTNESGTQLKKNIRQAVKQDDIVESFFKKYPDKEFTPLEVWQARFDDSTQITSVRRSITNLTKAGKLEETDIKREGAHGRSNYCWRLLVPKAPKEFYQEKLF
jgi:hypothetical protein